MDQQTENPVYRPFYGETGFPFIQFRVPGVERPKLPPMDELTVIDPYFNYQFVLKEKYLAASSRRSNAACAPGDWKIVCTPTAQGGRHFGLFNSPPTPTARPTSPPAAPKSSPRCKPRSSAGWTKNRILHREIFPQGKPE